MRVIIADDEGIERMFIKKLLERHFPVFSHIREAKNGIEALDLIKGFKPHLCLIDIRMPGLDGLKVVEEIRREGLAARVIISSAHDEFQYAQKAVQLGADAYLLKPVESVAMIREISRVLAEIERQQRETAGQKRLKELLENTIPVLRLNFFSEVIHGSKESSEILLERSRALGIERFPDGVLCAGLDITGDAGCDRTEASNQRILGEVYQLVQGLLGPHDVLLAPSGGLEFVVLVCTDPLKEDPDLQLLGIAENLRVMTEKTGWACLTVGVGQSCSKPAELYCSYNQARKAINHRLTLGGNQVIPYGRIAGLKLECSYPAHLEKELLARIELGDVPKVKELTRTIAEGAAAGGDPDHLRNCLVELLILASRASQIPLGARWWRDLDCHNTKELLVAWVNQRIVAMAENVAGRKEEEDNGIINQIQQHINNFYYQDLSLEAVARKFFLSPSYLSRIFKNETGSNFIEYVTMVRLRRAGQFLGGSEESIASIAGKVGYNDVKYFSRVFKKYMGVTPGEYRRQVSNPAGLPGKTDYDW
ncbi:MAG: HTH-type transcriptional regulator YesS [Firmicutes bacterium ADurb.Bin456]|nr:MAG: HTH-type transcriptional regulator YesS [Firmicutes bacterium ADurb.Bin456]